ncbi:hypothetical protein VTN77DRAFT_7487 [Rasamsonia byssochlamydoides]|uniref:uncharacterized protein n=1 Tax=Rasamsonia byssochlamydoides TaxID=89139 RepID=UPI003742F74F
MMFTKVIVFLAFWVLASLGIAHNLEHRAAALHAVPDNLDIRGMDEKALFEKFRKLLARDITSTVTVPSCIAIPTPLPSGGWTSASVITMTVPEISSIPGGEPDTTTPTSETSTSEPGSTTPVPGTTTPEPGSTTPVPGSTTPEPEPTSLPLPGTTVTSPAPSATPSLPGTESPAPAPSVTPSSAVPKASTLTSNSVPAHGTSTVPRSSASAPSRSPSPAPASNNALRNEGLGTAIIAMAVALGTLVAM